MRRVAIGAVLVVALAVTGCGGGGSKTLSKKEYASQLNQICQQAAAQEKQIGTPTSPGELATKGPKLRAALDQGIAKAEKLKPPGELKAAADKFVAETNQLSSLLGEIVDAAKKNDLVKLVPLGARAQALGKNAAAVGRSLGAPACALAPG